MLDSRACFLAPFSSPSFLKHFGSIRKNINKVGTT